MSQSEPITRHIAHNTLMLYLRTLLSVVVGLYTSRVVLRTLGVEDYGIFGLVGGLVSILGFLNTSMAGATSRFITFDLGLGDIAKLRQTFNAAFQSHLFIAFLIVLFAETVGLWLVNNYLDIPSDRYFAANCIYQFSILSAIVGITQAPYTAVVLAHEQMDVYAWLEIVNVSLKLVIVWLLQLTASDKLIFYGFLYLLVTLLIRILYRLFCRHHYPESHLSFAWYPQTFRKMLSFTGWNLYADASVTVRQQGINILINRFFGVVLNTSCGLASMVQGIFWSFGYNVVAAFRPQIIKQYSVGNYRRMQRLMEQASKFTMVLICLITVPVIIEMPYLLKLWLVDVPAYTIVFCRILLIDNLLGLLNYIINLGAYSQGDIKVLSIVSGTLKFLCLPIIFVLFCFHFPPTWAYWCNLICLLFIVVVDLFLLKIQVPQINIRSFYVTIVKSIILIFIVSLGYLFLQQALPDSFSYKFFACLLFGVLILLTSYFLLLDKDEVKGLNNYISKLL